MLLRWGHISKMLHAKIRKIVNCLAMHAALLQRIHFKTKQNLHGERFCHHAKLLIVWILIESTGFRLQNFTEQW